MGANKIRRCLRHKTMARLTLNMLGLGFLSVTFSSGTSESVNEASYRIFYQTTGRAFTSRNLMRSTIISHLGLVLSIHDTAAAFIIESSAETLEISDF